MADDPTPPVLTTPVIDLLRLREFVPFGLTGTPRTTTWELITAGVSHEARAVSDGRVTGILVNPQGGSQIHVRPTPASTWTVIYDYVGNVQVTAGDDVVAGTVLGTTSARTPTSGRVSLQVVNTGDPGLTHCPATFGTEAFNAAHEAAFATTGSPYPGVCLSDTAPK